MTKDQENTMVSLDVETLIKECDKLRAEQIAHLALIDGQAEENKALTAKLKVAREALEEYQKEDRESGCDVGYADVALEKLK